MRFHVTTFFKVLGVGTFLLIFTLALQAGPAPDAGGDLFKHKCIMCHGADGKGYPNMKTPDFTDPKFQAKHTDDEITKTIKNGKPGTVMPAFKDSLSDDQIKALVAYIRSLDSSKKK